MKKIIAMSILLIFLFTGCSSKSEVSSDKISEKLVYCDLCGEDAKEVTKFCPNCGKETKWLSEKPDIKEEITSEEDEGEQEEKVEEVQEKSKNTKESSSTENKSSQKSYKNKYLNKLAKLDEEEDYIWSTNSGTTYEMREDVVYMYQKWDDMLNEIYGVLKEQLSKSEMNALRDKQRAWINYREEEGKKAEEANGPGTLASIEYVGTKSEITRKRCYELVNVYMK